MIGIPVKAFLMIQYKCCYIISFPILKYICIRMLIKILKHFDFLVVIQCGFFCIYISCHAR